MAPLKLYFPLVIKEKVREREQEHTMNQSAQTGGDNLNTNINHISDHFQPYLYDC